MHTHWHLLMGKKTWRTVTEETLERGAAAMVSPFWFFFARKWSLSSRWIFVQIWHATWSFSMQFWRCDGGCKETNMVVYGAKHLGSIDVAIGSIWIWRWHVFFLEPKGRAEWKFVRKPFSWMVIQGKFSVPPNWKWDATVLFLFALGFVLWYFRCTFF